MQPDRLLVLLGRPVTDPAVEQVLDHFKIRRRPEPELDEEANDGPVIKNQDWLKNRRAGIEFGFEEERSFNGTGPARHPPYVMLLTQIYFYGEHAEVQPYVDSLPHGLVLADDRQRVRTKLARFEPTRRSWVRDTWEPPEYQLIVSYANDGAKIGFVLCVLRTPPSPNQDDITPLPALDDLIGVLGRRMDDPVLRKVVRPLGIDKYLQDRGDTVIALMREEFGIELHFGGIRSLDAIALTNIFLFRDREEDAFGWKGALPFKLDFDDSPEVLFKKLGKPPDQKSEEDFVGFALWHLPDYSLQVKYSTMFIWILSVRILGPGVWASDAVGAPDAAIPTAGSTAQAGGSGTQAAAGASGRGGEPNTGMPAVRFFGRPDLREPDKVRLAWSGSAKRQGQSKAENRRRIAPDCPVLTPQCGA